MRKVVVRQLLIVIVSLSSQLSMLIVVYSTFEVSCLYLLFTAMHGGCNYFALQVHYFIWQGSDLGGHNTVYC